jgi:uncharacterized protein YdeI (YjbR/CyaY-like superfamily)
MAQAQVDGFAFIRVQSRFKKPNRMKLGELLDVPDRRAWRAWLRQHHCTKKEIWLVLPTKASGRARISYNDTVEEALCYGWIDSIMKPVDARHCAQRFSARQPKSQLSPLNRERVRRLIAKKQMTRAGLAAIAHAFDPNAKEKKLVIPPDILRALKASRAAWANFRKFPAAYQRIRVGYVDGSRHHGPAVVRKRLNHLVKMSAQNKRFGFVRE